MGADRLRVEGQRAHPLDAVDDRLDALLVEEQAGDALDHGLGGPPAAEGQDRAPARHGLDGHDPEILLAGEDQGEALGIELAQPREGLRPEHGDGGARDPPDLVEHLAAAEHDEAAAHGVEGPHGEVRPLVGHELARHQPGAVPAALRIDVEVVDRHGRRDHLRLAPVVAGDALGDGARIRHEMVDPLGRERVPGTDVVGGGQHQRALQQAGRAAVLVEHVPDVAHGRVAVADVDGAGRRDHALGRPGFAADDQVVAAQVELLQRHRHQRQVVLVELRREGQPADEALDHPPAADQRAHRLGLVDVDEEVGLRIHPEQGFHDLLPAAHADEPVMDDGDAHAVTASIERGGCLCPGR